MKQKKSFDVWEEESCSFCSRFLGKCWWRGETKGITSKPEDEVSVQDQKVPQTESW